MIKTILVLILGMIGFGLNLFDVVQPDLNDSQMLLWAIWVLVALKD